MTDYSDVPTVSGLHQSRQSVTYAIGLIDSGGVMQTFMVGPEPSAPGTPPATTPGMPVSVIVVNASAELMAATRDWLVQRQAELDQQLAALGVTNPPPTNSPAGARAPVTPPRS